MELKNDALRCKFTAWMQVVVKRAKIDYIRSLKRHYNEVSIDDEKVLDKLRFEPISEIAIDDGFEFDNKLLAKLFMKLAPQKRKVLELLFVHKMPAEEVAAELQCSLQHVYNLRSLGLKELKCKLNKGELKNDRTRI